ncbi:hypothetical protein FRC03_009101 [Tulasnella sp. 419]|nr:hypothetical protein FRC03_009101 [Tulasnella sp. 419]
MQLMARLLTVGSRLEALYISTFDYSSWIIRNCNHQHLTTLSIWIPDSQYDPKDNHIYQTIYNYTKRHPNIKRLTILSVAELPPICWNPSDYLPNLDTFNYSGPTPSELLKGRHLTRIWLNLRPKNGEVEIEPTMSYISNMGATLLFLDLSESMIRAITWPSQAIRGFVRNLPLLRYLGLPRKFANSYSEDDLVDILQECPSTLSIFRMKHDGFPPPLPTLKLFAARETLKWIINTSTLYYENGFFGAFGRENPSIRLSDKSELRRTLLKLGVGVEPW